MARFLSRSPVRGGTDDELLARWAEHGDSAALAALFDSAAPRLLALAIHLVGEPERAEDLVQAVFLSLIEKRAQIEQGTPAEAWLLRVLRNKAIDQSRTRRAEPMGEGTVGVGALGDLEALDADVDRAAERRELEGRVSEAIDELPSPYREVLLARLRHGASAAEIAHLFDRSPGQVRVQLHRGLELLRARLPEREALAAVALLLPGSYPDCLPEAGSHATSLDVVRETVLAAAPTAAASAALPLTVTFMTKTKLFVAAAVVLAAVGYRMLHPGAAAPANEAELVMAEDLAQVPLGEPELLAPTSEAAREAPPETEAAPDVRELRGRIVTAESGLPIDGATVRLIRPAAQMEGWGELRLAEAYPELVMQTWDGGLRSRTGNDWPTPELVASGVLARPGDARNVTVDEVLTDSEGSYAIPVPTSLWKSTLLDVEAPNRGARLRALAAPEEVEAAIHSESDPAFALQPDIALYAESAVTVQLMTRDGVPLHRALDLSVVSQRAAQPFVLLDSGVIDPDSIEFLAAWKGTTDETGRLALRVFGDRPSVSVVTPGWAGAGTHPREDGALLEFHVRETSRFLILDDDTGAPLERASLTFTSRADQRTYRSGEFHLPGGVYGFDGSGGYYDRECPMDLVGWTAEHEPASLVIEDFHEPREYVLRLRPGSPARLTGRVVDRAGPVAGVKVGVSQEVLRYWHPEGLRRPIVQTTTDAEGRFQLAAPRGTYVLQLRRFKKAPAQPDACLVVQLPGDEPCDVNLDELGEIQIRVTVGGGSPEGEITLVLDGPDGRRSQPLLDADGEVTFSGLPPGRYLANPVQFRGAGAAFSAREPEPLTVLPGQRLKHTFALGLDRPGTCRLVHPSVQDFSEWRFMTGGVSWRSVQASGELDAPMHRGFNLVKVENAAGRRYRFFVEGGNGEDHSVLLKRGDCGYRGVLKDENGEPIGGVWVEASPLGLVADESRRGLTLSVLTAQDGSFQFDELLPRPYGFRFEEAETKRRRWEPRWQNFRFEPDGVPQSGVSAPALEIRLVRGTELVEVRGLLVDGEGQPTAGHVSGSAIRTEGQGGRLLVFGKGRSMGVGPDGAFTIALPVGVPNRVRAWADGAEQAQAEELLTLDPGVTPPPLRLVVFP